MNRREAVMEAYTRGYRSGWREGEADAAPRRALIRLLWREVADGGGCVCEPNDPTDTCEAMRALGWGQHWNARDFQKRAMQEGQQARAQRPREDT